jgi:hypothetical protein
MWFMDYPTKDTFLTSLLMASPQWCWKGFVVFFLFIICLFTYWTKTGKNTKCSTKEHELLTYIKYKPKIIITDIHIILTDMITDIYKILTNPITDIHKILTDTITDINDYWQTRLLTCTKYWQTQLLTYPGYW